MTEPAVPGPRTPLPGMAAVSLWMLGLSVVGVVGVLSGHYPQGRPRIAILLLCTLFAIAGLGLLRLRRWGWALTLAAVFLCACFWFYSHAFVMGIINLVLFLYLVRPEVTSRLR